MKVIIINTLIPIGIVLIIKMELTQATGKSYKGGLIFFFELIDK